MVTKARVCFFVCYLYTQGEREINPANFHHVEVYPDSAYQIELITKEQGFWRMVETKKPPIPSSRDYKTLKGHAKLFNKYKTLKAKISVLEEELETVETEMKKLAEESKHPRVKCVGVHLVQVARAGNIDYAKIPQLKGVDLEPFRKKGSVYWKTSIEKETED